MAKTNAWFFIKFFLLPNLTLALAGADGCIRNSRHKVSERGILVRVAALFVRTATGTRQKLVPE
jgi:hypothetical protein